MEGKNLLLTPKFTHLLCTLVAGRYLNGNVKFKGHFKNACHFKQHGG